MPPYQPMLPNGRHIPPQVPLGNAIICARLYRPRQDVKIIELSGSKFRVMPVKASVPSDAYLYISELRGIIFPQRTG